MASKDDPNRVLIEEISWQIAKHVENVSDAQQRENAAQAILDYLRKAHAFAQSTP